MKMLVLSFALAIALAAPVSSSNAQTRQASKTMILYKNPQCGCCDGYAAYMRTHGYSVTVVPAEDLDDITRQDGIPEGFEGCHVSLIDGYAVGGHVPVNIVEKLLTERPNVRAISLPGMPSGSPGMDGAKTAPFTVYRFADGKPSVYVTE